MLKPGEIAIVSGAGTPWARCGGKLKGFTSQELGAVAGKCAIERAGLDPREFLHPVFGSLVAVGGAPLLSLGFIYLWCMASGACQARFKPAVDIFHLGFEDAAAALLNTIFAPAGLFSIVSWFVLRNRGRLRRERCSATLLTKDSEAYEH